MVFNDTSCQKRLYMCRIVYHRTDNIVSNPIHYTSESISAHNVVVLTWYSNLDSRPSRSDAYNTSISEFIVSVYEILTVVPQLQGNQCTTANTGIAQLDRQGRKWHDVNYLSTKTVCTVELYGQSNCFIHTMKEIMQMYSIFSYTMETDKLFFIVSIK